MTLGRRHTSHALLPLAFERDQGAYEDRKRRRPAACARDTARMRAHIKATNQTRETKSIYNIRVTPRKSNTEEVKEKGIEKERSK